MRYSIIILLSVIIVFSPLGVAAHPKILTNFSDRDAVYKKIQTCPWAKEAYRELKDRVAPYIQHCSDDPEWLTSRLMMNWDTHYITDVCEKSRWAGGKGRASVPTPRFAGARDWVSKYKSPPTIADFKPYNDNDGKVWLVNGETNTGEWTAPGITGRIMESMNDRIVSLAADAAFIYWLEGDEAYAKLADGVLWTYMHGFSYKTAPEFPPSDEGMARIIGMTSFEVIHEDIVTPLSLCYDFLHDYLQKEGRDVVLVQNQLKRMIDRVIEGGFADGNWNLNQARIIAFGGLALEGNAAYADEKGCSYYVDIVLNARLKTQLGLTYVIKEGYDIETALWPEAPGYGFGTTGDMVRMAALTASDPAGQEVLQNPLLGRAVISQLDMIYPNGYSCGLGDTNNTRINTLALELLIASARKQSDSENEAKLTAALQREIDAGFYDRSEQSNLLALTQYVGILKPAADSTVMGTQTCWAEPLNIMIQKNVVESEDYSLAAAMFGTDGGHVHSNGLAMELYGAGVILGADPGRGSSYWQPDHGQYYSKLPAHNTVIINGSTDYPAYGEGRIKMRPVYMEPSPGSDPLSPNISFIQGQVQYNKPIAKQQRTLALIRISDTSGFYLDIFRSRAKGKDNFHDYLYHNIGQSIVLVDAEQKPLSMKSSDLLNSEHGCLKGYDYFKNEKSAEMTQDLHAIFSAEMPDGTKRNMDLWMLGQKSRHVFTVEAPGNRAARGTPTRGFVEIPMPTLLVRQHSDAWKNPFVTIYEPYMLQEGKTIQTVRLPEAQSGDSDLVTCVVEGYQQSYTAYLMVDDINTQAHQVEQYRFQGGFGVVMLKGQEVSELYLADGQSIGDEDVYISSVNKTKVNASVLRQADRWRYSSSAPIKIQVKFPIPSNAVSVEELTVLCESGQDQVPLKEIQLRIEETDTEEVIIASCLLSEGYDRYLSIRPISDKK